MTTQKLQLVVRTPKRVVLDDWVDSLRVPTESGQVGLRPRTEASVLAIEAGLILVRSDHRETFVGTAGGLLHNMGLKVSLLTPLAVTGNDLATVSRQLDELLAAPDEEMEIRSTLGRLENRILKELQVGDAQGKHGKQRS